MVFENSVPKANFGQNIRDSPNGSLTADSRSLQTATLKNYEDRGAAEADNIPQDLHNSLDDMKAVSNNIVLLFKIIPTM